MSSTATGLNKRPTPGNLLAKMTKSVKREPHASPASHVIITQDEEDLEDEFDHMGPGTEIENEESEDMLGVLGSEEVYDGSMNDDDFDEEDDEDEEEEEDDENVVTVEGIEITATPR